MFSRADSLHWSAWSRGGRWDDIGRRKISLRPGQVKGVRSMPVYHQIGHQSDNLLTEPLLDQYAGAILSPVNYDELSMLAQVQMYRRTGNRDVIFDPQIYYPRTELVRLRTWSYFPSD